MYWKKEAYKKNGLIFGIFLIGIFGSRFVLEFIKNNQEVFESNLSLNMGQILSLPFIIWGIWLIVRSSKVIATNSK
jgi:prolipoprotein diacylglyceryltransferase